MELITGVHGKPHVTSAQHRAIFENIIGKGSYILNYGDLLEPELQSNQSLRIRSGVLFHHGSISEVKRNTYDEVTLINGSQGMKRVDLIVARYTKSPDTEFETMTWMVIQGTPSESNPAVPEYTIGNMQEGDLVDDCPVFEVHIEGIQVTQVVKLLDILDGNLAELNGKLTELNGKLTTTITPSSGFTFSSNNVIKKGHVAMIYAKVSGTLKTGVYNVIGTLPEGFRPATRDVFIASSDTTIFHERLASITIMTNGDIRVMPGGIDLTGVFFSTVFITGD